MKLVFESEKEKQDMINTLVNSDVIVCPDDIVRFINGKNLSDVCYMNKKCTCVECWENFLTQNINIEEVVRKV